MPTLPEGLLLHSSTRTAVEGYLRSPSHAVLLEGPVGVGKHFLVLTLADQISGKTVDKRILVDSPDKILKIEQIRLLKDQLKLRAVSGENRTILIPDADRLTPDAQNALLKLLEEPPASSYFMLSTSDRQKLLPTVVSRCSIIPLRRVSSDEFTSYAKAKGHATDKINRAYSLSDGSAGMGITLLTSDSGTLAELENAKQLLGMNQLDRLKQVDKLSKDKASLPDLFFGLERLLLVGMHASNTKKRSVDAWVSKLIAVEEAETALSHNVTTRLLLTQLFIKL